MYKIQRFAGAPPDRWLVNREQPSPPLVLSPVSREHRVSMFDVLYGQLQFVGLVFVLLGPLAMLVRHERKLKRWLLKGQRRRKRPVFPALS
jgi:hypothetical protein